MQYTTAPFTCVSVRIHSRQQKFLSSLCSTVPIRSSILLTNADAVPMRSGVFLGAMQICIARISYGNVAGWVAGWVAVCHSQYCIKTTKPILKL